MIATTDLREKKGKRKRWSTFAKWIQFIGQISVTIAIAIYAIFENNRDKSIAEQNRQQEMWIANETRFKDYSIAESNRLHDLYMADEKQKDDIFNDYHHFLGETIIQYGLQLNHSAVRYAVRYKTLAALKLLDPSRRTYLIESLIEMKLVSYIDELSEFNLSPIIDLRTGNLTGVDLSGKDIGNINRICLAFDQTILNDASFHRTYLHGSSFIETKLNNADFSYSDNQYDERCKKQDDFMFSTSFAKSQMVNVNFSHTEFRQIDFSFANMFRADLSYSNLIDRVFFSNTILNSARLYHLKILSKLTLFGNTQMIGVDARYAIITEATFQGANLINSSLNYAKFYNSSFGNSNMTNCQLFNVELINVHFTNTILINANLSHLVCLSECSFVGAIVIGVSLFNASILNSDLRNAKFTEEQLAEVKSFAGSILPNGTRLIQAKKKIAVALSPKLFAFGGGTKPVSQLLFNKYDTDQSGLISVDELRFLCYDMGYFLSDAQLDWARTLIDKDGSGEISYKEFSSWWQNPLRFDHLLLTDDQLSKLHQITDLFRSFDKKNQGELDKKQFNELFQELIQQKLMEENQANQFDEIDRSNDGKINFNELIAWFYDQRVLEKMGVLPEKKDEDQK
ncbi:hypothetical protein I4U23_011813 [Adineta vaga]|nr:hypothetical protein I4U23_011813 [Adineta vaga]